IDYEQDETEFNGSIAVVGTRFQNNTVNGRVELEQRPSSRLSGRIGMEGLHRIFEASGEEALAPRTRQMSTAVFGYEELGLRKHRLQLGGRIEGTSYTP